MTTMTAIADQIADLEQQLAKLKQQQSESALLPKMVKIPDRHYSVAETPVTVAQYEFFCSQTGRECPTQPDPHNPNNPVTNVSWEDAQNYCRWLAEQTGDDYRLPTEDEFEHFCGDHTEANEEIAVYNKSNITPTKTKHPNKYGLYDVLGLVWEWQENPYE